MHRILKHVCISWCVVLKAQDSAPFRMENSNRNQKSVVVVRAMRSWIDHSWGNYFQNVRESMLTAFLFDIPFCLDWDQPEWLRRNVSALFDLRKAKLCSSFPINISRVDKICFRETSKRFYVFEKLSEKKGAISLDCEGHQHTQKFFDTGAFSKALQALSASSNKRLAFAADLIINFGPRSLSLFIVPYYMAPSAFLHHSMRESVSRNDLVTIQIRLGDSLGQMNKRRKGYDQNKKIDNATLDSICQSFATAGRVDDMSHVHVDSDTIAIKQWFVDKYGSKVVNSKLGKSVHMADMTTTTEFHDMITDWMYCAEAHYLVVTKASSFCRSARCSFGTPSFISSSRLDSPSSNGVTFSSFSCSYYPTIDSIPHHRL